MSLRQSWRFRYYGHDLLQAAEAMCDYHTRHALYWTAERKNLELQIRKQGITLTEQQVTGGVQFRTEVNSALSEQYNTATTKEREHKTKAEGYQPFALAFQLNPDAELDLDVDDLMFFRLSIGPPKDELHT